MSVTGIILAAGEGRRMGGARKQLSPLCGRPLLQHVIDAAASAPLDGVIVVLGHAADELAAAVRLPEGVEIVVNPGYAAGQATSLRVGLDQAPAAARAAVVLLGDQPGVRADAIGAVVAAHAASGAPILRASYRGRASHPVLLDRAVWPAARSLRGDAGARSLIAAHAGRVEMVEVGGDPPEDVDTPDDLARLRGRSGDVGENPPGGMG